MFARPTVKTNEPRGTVSAASAGQVFASDARAPIWPRATHSGWMPWMDDHGMRPPIPILRMYDVDATKRFYVDYLGFELDWQEGEGDRPVYMRVSRGPVALHLSSHAGDGTPGTAIVIQVDDVTALHRELHRKAYPFMNPGIEPRGIGKEVTVLDPASNQVGFFEAGKTETDA